MFNSRNLSFVSLVILSALWAVAATAADAPLALKLAASDEFGLVVGDQTTVTFELDGAPVPAGEHVVKTVLEDFDGKVVEEKTHLVDLSQKPLTSQIVKFDRYGGWLLRAGLYATGGDKPLAEGKLRLVRAVPPAKLTPQQLEASPVGISVHVHGQWKLLRNVGIHWARDYTWGLLKTGGSLPFGTESWSAKIDYKKLAEDALANDVMILACMQGGYRSPDGRFFMDDAAGITAGYAKLAKAIPAVKYWELDNEAELQHRSDPAAMKKWETSYRAYIPAAAEGLRSAGADRVLVLNGDAGIEYDRAADLLASPLAKDFGVINCHYYTGSIAPELSRRDFNTSAANPLAAAGFLDRLRQYADLAHKHGKQAWLTEVGWDEINGPAVGTRNQALFLPRMYLLSEFCGVDKTFWFFDRDTDGKGIFSTMGLEDDKHNVRYLAATMAAVSKFIATADYAGSIDLGDKDHWCLAFRTADQKWLVAAWTVEAEHPVPAELAGAKAFDVFGNPAKPTKLTQAVSYFELDEMPLAWKGQLPARWMTHMNMTGFPGQRIMLEVDVPAGAKVTFSDLPKGVSVTSQPDAEGQFSLECEPGLAMGQYAFKATAAGEGWQKSWALTLRIIPPLQVRSQPYTPGQPAEIEIASNAPKSQVTLELPPQAGTLSATSLTVEGSATGKVTFTAAPGSVGPLHLTCRLADGAVQDHWLRPRQFAVPQVKIEVDGDVADWPDAARLDATWMETSNPDFVPTGWIGWSEEGLYLAARIPFREAISGRPEEFYEFPAFELFVNPDAASHDNWPMTSHQFWFMPMSREGKLTVNVGEWKRTAALKDNNLDVQGMTTAIRVEGNVAYVEVLVPAKLIGAAPAAGSVWRAVLSYQDVKREEYSLGAVWPQGKGGVDGILTGTAKWGQILFTGPTGAEATGRKAAFAR